MIEKELRDFFEELNREFPIPEAKMDRPFKGKHHIILQDEPNAVCVQIWLPHSEYGAVCKPIYFEADDTVSVENIKIGLTQCGTLVDGKVISDPI